MSMEREIKFRAWDKENKAFTSNYECANVIHELLVNKKTDVLEHYELMQFSGLRDKNGKEIYEGDIVSAWSEGYNHKGEIRWMLEGAPRIIIYPAFANQGFWHLHGFKNETGKMTIDVIGNVEVCRGNKITYADDGVEIIGNIYETDLLK